MSSSISRRVRTIGSLGAAIVALGTGAPSASAISSDFCGYAIATDSRCWDGTGYRGWRYHQASTGGRIVPSICAYAWTGSNYRSGSGCQSSANFYAFQYCSAQPTTTSSVQWSGGAGPVVIFGHADSRACGSAAIQLTEGDEPLPAYIAASFRDPASAGQAGVDPATARAVATSDGASVFQIGDGMQRCILRADGSGWAAGCTTSAQIAADGGRQLMGERVESGYRVYGMVGAGASSATIETVDGSSKSAAITGSGAIVVTTRSRPTEVEIRRGWQQESAAITTP